ncbi:helix-turn-helix domain-containing protein [Ralstonia pseudosolanacearum]|uniref:helix-turn-helix domain-containing protein n=1 Tax=Ralstonia pseudosolanacearum TaxID=1310165 RepID=UPI001FF852A6|nr:helix-turn-helix domain-containing protein [Ralstonia pseudosolanacearum]
MNIKPWSKMPVEWIVDGTIKAFSWTADGAVGTAALAVFYALCHLAVERQRLQPLGGVPTDAGEALSLQVTPNFAFVAAAIAQPGVPASPVQLGLAHATETEWVAAATYDTLAALAGLSRTMVSAGLAKLEERKMIRRRGTLPTGHYAIANLCSGQRWAKLPGQALLSPARTTFKPLDCFHLRSGHELNALKLHFYYASVRSAQLPYSTATFETIWQRTGVPERDIPRANSLLVTSGLLVLAGADGGADRNQHEPNRYYMTGYQTLTRS